MEVLTRTGASIIYLNTSNSFCNITIISDFQAMAPERSSMTPEPEFRGSEIVSSRGPPLGSNVVRMGPSLPSRSLLVRVHSVLIRPMGIMMFRSLCSRIRDSPEALDIRHFNTTLVSGNANEQSKVQDGRCAQTSQIPMWGTCLIAYPIRQISTFAPYQVHPAKNPRLLDSWNPVYKPSEAQRWAARQLSG